MKDYDLGGSIKKITGFNLSKNLKNHTYKRMTEKFEDLLENGREKKKKNYNLIRKNRKIEVRSCSD